VCFDGIQSVVLLSWNEKEKEKGGKKGKEKGRRSEAASIHMVLKPNESHCRENISRYFLMVV
jgi:hypothetical protein